MTTEPAPDTRHTPGFLSLKWKALVLTSLVLLAGAAALTGIGYTNLTQQFEQYRGSVHDRHTRESQALLHQSLQSLQQLGGLIPSLTGMREALLSGDAAAVETAFDPQWPVLQLDAGIEEVRFYDADNRLLHRWGMVAPGADMDAVVEDWITQVRDNEAPVTKVWCRQTCVQYAVVPMLVEGRNVGVIIVATSLADVVRNLQQVSGNDIGLMVTGYSEDTLRQAGDRYLEPWGGSIIALTHAQENLPVLRAAAARWDPADVKAPGSRLNLNDRHYEVTVVPVNSLAGDSDAQLVIVADITDEIGQIQRDTRMTLAVGLSGWIVAELLLLAFLWTPMARLRRVAMQLPLLAQGQFGNVRDTIAPDPVGRRLRDEIDVLDTTAIDLSHQLEKLENQVAERNRTLSQRMDELSRERDFIERLLDTAQAIILTQDRDGRVIMVNQYGEWLSGYDEQALKGTDFTSIFAAHYELPDMAAQFQALADNRQPYLRHEGVLVCKDGSMRTIAWYHSALSPINETDPAILSVGLDITERKGAEDRLAWLANHDSLTGLYNRRHFQKELESALAAAVRYRRKGAVLYFDLDEFKDVNDLSGHHAGDALLKTVADNLAQHLRFVDLVVRLGGDEFAVLLRETDQDGAIRVADKVNDVLGQIQFSASGRRHQVSASIGIAMFPDHGDSASDLLANADLAMYQAKEAGRGHWHLLTTSDQSRERLQRLVYWKTKVQQAISEDRFLLYLQPIMDVQTGGIAHYEVLIRMRGDTDASIIGPDQFIHAAERSGLIQGIDRLVLSKAVALQRMAAENDIDITLSINLSAHAFRDPELLRHLQHEIEHHGVDPERLIFEITETVAVADFTAARNLMLAIKSLGCRFALDDFGVGFSSFYYLKHLPVDFVKIDGSFIQHLAESPDDQVIVQAIAQIVSGFGKTTIAEFVETEGALKLLKQYGVHYAQGFYISRPVPTGEALAISDLPTN